MSAKYQGWANYETWAVALWLNNDQGMQEQAMSMAAGHAKDDAGAVADAIKEWVESDMIPDLGASLAADLLGAAVADVDWYEIAQSFIAHGG